MILANYFLKSGSIRHVIVYGYQASLASHRIIFAELESALAEHCRPASLLCSDFLK